MTKSLLFIQFQFFLAFLPTTVINNNINVDILRARASSIQIFVNHLKCLTQERFKIFILKAATSGLH